MPTGQINLIRLTVQGFRTLLTRDQPPASTGTYPPIPDVPVGLGLEAAGEIVAVPEGSRLGDRVMGMTSIFVNGFGEHAEYAYLLEAETRPVPTHLGDEQAAGFVIGFRTAHAALVERCAIESGDTLVVLGAAGNSGASAAQLGKALGATVIVVASNQHKLAYCTAIGADHVVNYTVDNGCLRTLTGAQQFCAIRSYLSTAAKHGKHFFDTLVMLTEGHPWLPATN